ncbi:spermatogenesis-associated protein 4 [Kappamyces sp. JEL0829]|nr:spermatogenesis-associated protein 4 [Kappamyces sp. JEL0829]
MTGFTREVIKWLQSLELGVAITNPKRDFANGYLVAAIFARYYPGELQPWSLYTGHSRGLKANNWSVIEKFFLRHHIDIPREAVEAVMNCQSGAAIRFVENVYTLLTNKPVPRLQSPPTQEIVPHFALPTTSNAIRSLAESPEKAVVVLEAHRKFLSHLRAQRTVAVRKDQSFGKPFLPKERKSDQIAVKQ